MLLVCAQKHKHRSRMPATVLCVCARERTKHWQIEFCGPSTAFHLLLILFIHCGWIEWKRQRKRDLPIAIIFSLPNGILLDCMLRITREWTKTHVSALLASEKCVFYVFFSFWLWMLLLLVAPDSRSDTFWIMAEPMSDNWGPLGAIVADLRDNVIISVGRAIYPKRNTKRQWVLHVNRSWRDREWREVSFKIEHWMNLCDSRSQQEEEEAYENQFLSQLNRQKARSRPRKWQPTVHPQ